MMVIDTVHSSGVGRMHAGHTRRMKIVRSLHSLQGSEAKRPILSSTSTVEKKSITTVNLESRPSLVIRRRIMVPLLEEADDAAFHQLAPAMSNQPKSSTTASTTLNHSQEKKLMDRNTARSHLDVIFARSPASTQDQVCNNSAAATTKPPKTLHLFDLNKLPTLPDSLSPIASPTSTIASADSTTDITTDAASTLAMATDETFFSNSSPSIIRTFTDVEGDAHRGEPKLAVDLGLLPPASPEITRRQNVVEDSSMQPQYTGLLTPARKRLRKLSECAGGHSSTHDAFMGKSWTTDGGGVCNHPGVTKTLASPEPKTKVCGKVVVDEEVLGAACVLFMLSSSKKRRREFSSSIAVGNTTVLDEEKRREAMPSTPFGSDLAASDTTSSRSLESGGSVLLRPSNKQRYRSVAEVMAKTPILRRL